MPTLYLTEPRSLVRLDGECLLVQVPEDRRSGRERRTVEVPLLKLDDVVVLGEVTLTASAIGALMERAIPVCYLGAHGQYRGTLLPEPSRHAQLRIAQHRAHQEPERRLALARGFVRGKLANMRTILLRQHRALLSDDLLLAAEALKRGIGGGEEEGGR